LFGNLNAQADQFNNFHTTSPQHQTFENLNGIYTQANNTYHDIHQQVDNNDPQYSMSFYTLFVMSVGIFCNIQSEIKFRFTSNPSQQHAKDEDMLNKVEEVILHWSRVHDYFEQANQITSEYRNSLKALRALRNIYRARLGMTNSFISAFPNFQQGKNHDVVVFGCRLVKKTPTIEYKDVPENELQHGDADDFFLKVRNWAKSHGYVAGYPTFYEDGNKYEIVLLKNTIVEHRNVPKNETAGSDIEPRFVSLDRYAQSFSNTNIF